MALPEGFEDLIDEPMEKYEFEEKKWWQGRWEIYVIFLAFFVFFFLRQLY